MNVSSPQVENLSAQQRIMDFGIHGIITVRLIDATAGDAAAISDLLGPPLTSLNQAPDIIIRFEERLSVPSLKYLGLNAMGFTDEGFYVLSYRSGEVQARIPFEKIGDQCEILCQSGLGFIPLLSEIITLTFLKKNYLPLHASAFLFNGVGILALGWTKGGKTEALLSFANHGAQYIGDEWVVLSADGQDMFGIPNPITLWDWQIRYIPQLVPQISTRQKILFKGIHFLDAINRTVGQGRLKDSFPLEILSQALPALKRQLKIEDVPQLIFGNSLCKQGATPDKLFLMMSHSEPVITVEPCHPLEIARRMKYSNETEQMYFFEHYKAFKFAFPHLRNEFLEQVDELQSSLLGQALNGKEAYKVLHPYPVSFEALFDHLRPFCQATSKLEHPVTVAQGR